jgi:hypothetical protein
MSTPSLTGRRPKGNRVTPSRPSPTCIDLAQRFGRRYRVEYGPAYSAQYGRRARVNDPWLKIIPCRAGHLCPWGGSKLAAVTDRAGPLARKLAALPGVKLWQDGNDGATVLFDVADFGRVAKVMRPKRRRKPPTQAQLNALAEGRRPFGQIPVDKCGRKALESTQSILFDLEAIPTGSAVSVVPNTSLTR